MKAIFRILGTAAAVAATGAAIVIMDKLLNEKAAPIIESIEFPEEAEQLDVRQKHKVNVLAVRHGEQGALDASPKPDRAIEPDDLLFIMGENKFVSRVVELG